MLDNILDDNYTTELYDLSLNILMSTQTEQCTLDRDAIFGSSFLDNQVQLETETFRFNSGDVLLLFIALV